MSKLTVIENKLLSEETANRLTLALNLDPKNEADHRKAKKFAHSVLAEVQKSATDVKRDLTVCTPDSIVQAMIDAANFQLAIDGRQHAHLVKYGTSANFQIGYRGYLYALKRAYPDADFTVELIFEGDDVKISVTDEGQTFVLDRKSDPFNQDKAKFKGVLFAVTYTENGRLVKKCMAVPKERIERAKKAAKQDFIWNSDYFEKAKAAAIKNACKTMFASIQALQDMIEHDNKDYDPDRQPAAETRSKIIDNINASVTGEVAEEEPEVIEGEIITLFDDGKAAAENGVESYTEWLSSLTDEQKEEIRPRHKELSKIAKEIDNA